MLRQDKQNPESAWEVKIPLLLLIIGMVILIAGSFLFTDLVETLYVLASIALILLLYVPLTIAAMYIVAVLLDISYGFLKTALLKLASITIFSVSLNHLGEWFGVWILGWLFALAATYYLFSSFFDLDIHDTVYSVIGISVIRFFLGLLVAGILGSFIS